MMKMNLKLWLCANFQIVPFSIVTWVIPLISKTSVKIHVSMFVKTQKQNQNGIKTAIESTTMSSSKLKKRDEKRRTKAIRSKLVTWYQQHFSPSFPFSFFYVIFLSFLVSDLSYFSYAFRCFLRSHFGSFFYVFIFIFEIYSFTFSFQILMPDKEKIKLASTEKRKADDIDQIKDLKKVKKIYDFYRHFHFYSFSLTFFLFRSRRWKEK